MESRHQGCRVFVENPSGDFYHPGRGHEFLSVLERLPTEFRQPVRAIILRRTPKLDFKLGIEARMRFRCVILNSFPRSNEMVWKASPTQSVRRHYTRWCSRWIEKEVGATLQWTSEEIRRYYLFHLFLHEVGHVNQPLFHDSGRREGFAENFALEWAANFAELPMPCEAGD